MLRIEKPCFFFYLFPFFFFLFAFPPFRMAFFFVVVEAIQSEPLVWWWWVDQKHKLKESNSRWNRRTTIDRILFLSYFSLSSLSFTPPFFSKKSCFTSLSTEEISKKKPVEPIKPFNDQLWTKLQKCAQTSSHHRLAGVWRDGREGRFIEMSNVCTVLSTIQTPAFYALPTIIY